MIKKLLLTILFALALQPTFLFASEKNKELTLNIQFDAIPNKPFYETPLHINKIIKIDTKLEKNNVVMTQSQITENFPVTLAMLVKPTKINSDQVTLQFNLVSYGFKQGGSIATQPKSVLKNGKVGEIKNELFDLKVTANWNSKA